METGKTSKYLKYAIGEIVLVVIGILIALSINNWNENRKHKITELAFAKSLVKDLNEDIKALESAIEYNDLKVSKLDSLLTYAGTNINAMENQNQLYSLLKGSILNVSTFQNQNRTLLKLSDLDTELIRPHVSDSIALFQQNIINVEGQNGAYVKIILDVNAVSQKLFKTYNFINEAYFVNEELTGKPIPTINKDVALQDEFFNILTAVRGITNNYTSNFLKEHLQKTKDLKYFLGTEYKL